MRTTKFLMTCFFMSACAVVSAQGLSSYTYVNAYSIKTDVTYGGITGAVATYADKISAVSVGETYRLLYVKKESTDTNDSILETLPFSLDVKGDVVSTTHTCAWATSRLANNPSVLSIKTEGVIGYSTTDATYAAVSEWNVPMSVVEQYYCFLVVVDTRIATAGGWSVGSAFNSSFAVYPLYTAGTTDLYATTMGPTMGGIVSTVINPEVVRYITPTLPTSYTVGETTYEGEDVTALVTPKISDLTFSENSINLGLVSSKTGAALPDDLCLYDVWTATSLTGTWEPLTGYRRRKASDLNGIDINGDFGDPVRFFQVKRSE